jgi:phage protein D
MLLDFLSAKRRQPAECVITVAGREIVDFYPFLAEVTVAASRSTAATARLRFETRRDERGRWSVEDAGVFSTWATLKIEAAFGPHREEVFRGYVREVAADYPSNAGEATVTVECQDDSLALDREQRRRNWGADVPTTDQMILAAILGDYGLALHPESCSGQSGLVLNQDATDIAFLRERAEANGYELIFSAGQVYFGPLRVSAAPQETILVYAGPDTHCSRLTVRSDGHRPERVMVQLAATDGDQVDEQIIVPDLPLMGTQSAESQGAGLRDFTWRLSRQGGRNEAEMRARAQRHANENSLRVRAEGELDSTQYGHVLQVGLPVAVDGVGEQLSGTYYVDEVIHRFSVDGYTQGFTLLRNAYGDNVPAGASVLAGVL